MINDLLDVQASLVIDLLQWSRASRLFVHLSPTGGKDPVAWAAENRIRLPDAGLREICHNDAYSVLYQTLQWATGDDGAVAPADGVTDWVDWTALLMQPYAEKISGSYFTAATPKPARLGWRARAESMPPLGLLVMARERRLCIWPATVSSRWRAAAQAG